MINKISLWALTIVCCLVSSKVGGRGSFISFSMLLAVLRIALQEASELVNNNSDDVVGATAPPDGWMLFSVSDVGMPPRTMSGASKRQTESKDIASLMNQVVSGGF